MSVVCRLKHLSDFEWASVAQYVVYISSIAGLAEVNSRYVVDFPLGRLGSDRLLKRKQRVLFLLESNMKRVERFVGEHRSELNDNERAVLRTMYMQYKSNAETVKGHIEVASQCISEIELAIEMSWKEDEDDQLF